MAGNFFTRDGAICQDFCTGLNEGVLVLNALATDNFWDASAVDDAKAAFGRAFNRYRAAVKTHRTFERRRNHDRWRPIAKDLSARWIGAISEEYFQRWDAKTFQGQRGKMLAQCRQDRAYFTPKRYTDSNELVSARQNLRQAIEFCRIAQRKVEFAKLHQIGPTPPAPAIRIPLPAGYVAPVPMVNTQQVVADLGRPILDSFLAVQAGRPASDAPSLPATLNAHPLFDSLNLASAHIIASAERAPKAFRAATALETLAVFSAAHETTFAKICARIRASGAVLSDSRLIPAVRRFEAQVLRESRIGGGWLVDSKGLPDAANTDNVAVFLRTVGAEVRFNAWTNRIEIRSSPAASWAPLQERDFNQLMTTAANGQHNYRPRDTTFKRAIASLAHEATFDPVLERLASAQAAWDGVPRLDTWLVNACGVPDDPYHRAAGRNVIGGIVKRARRPGCKHDEVAIFIGPQDTLKSTMCRALAIDDDWFTDSVTFDGSPQNVVPQLFGKLVVELAELDGMARREVNFVKRFLSTQMDSVTLKYEAFSSDHARRCIFVGTSNDDNPLRDATGNRRFLPVRIERRIDVEWLRTNLDQLIGEAATLEAAGELFLIPSGALADARAHQEAARAESDFEIHLHAWFGSSSVAAYIVPADLATLLKDATGRSVPSNSYGQAMRRLGFAQMTPRIDGAPTRVWCRGRMEDAARYYLHRSGDNRLTPKLLSAPPAPPILPGSATVLPMLRPPR